jgi:hypothetical protein
MSEHSKYFYFEKITAKKAKKFLSDLYYILPLDIERDIRENKSADLVEYQKTLLKELKGLIGE